MLVLRPTDKVAIVIGEVRLKISPLTSQDKSEILSFSCMRNGVEERDTDRQIVETLRRSVKEISGAPEMELIDGGKAKFEWEDNKLNEESAGFLMQVLGMLKAPSISTGILLGKFHDMGEGIALEPWEKKAQNT